MISLCAAATAFLVGGQTAPGELKEHIVLASMFKNGYAVVLREMDVPRSGEFVLKQIPQASLGTLWLTTSPGVTLQSVVNSEFTTSVPIPAQTIGDLLALNIGKRVTLLFIQGEPVTGTLLGVNGNIVLVKTGENTTVFDRGMISRVISPDTLTSSSTANSVSRGLRLTVEGGGKVYMVSMERGMTWAPGYAVSLKEGKKLQIVGKATVLNDLEDLDGVEARFITGFPNVPFAGLPEPITTNLSADQFIGMISGIGAPVYRNPSGGARGRANEMMSQNAAAPAMDFGGSMPISDLGGMQAEDLFFYRQPNVKLKKGDRGYFIVFNAEAPYDELYTWDLDDNIYDATYRPQPGTPEPEDVWHTIRFDNTSKQPFTTGAATIFKDGQIIGQDMMHYVTAGAKAELKITKALDVHAEQAEEEIAREKGAIKNTGNYPTHDLVTLKGTLVVTNRKSEAVSIRVRKELTGEVVGTTPEAKVTKTAKGLRDINSRAQVEWTQKVEPGKKLTLTYTYKVYIRV